MLPGGGAGKRAKRASARSTDDGLAELSTVLVVVEFVREHKLEGKISEEINFSSGRDFSPPPTLRLIVHTLALSLFKLSV